MAESSALFLLRNLAAETAAASWHDDKHDTSSSSDNDSSRFDGRTTAEAPAPQRCNGPKDTGTALAQRVAQRQTSRQATRQITRLQSQRQAAAADASQHAARLSGHNVPPDITHIDTPAPAQLQLLLPPGHAHHAWQDTLGDARPPVPTTQTDEAALYHFLMRTAPSHVTLRSTAPGPWPGRRLSCDVALALAPRSLNGVLHQHPQQRAGGPQRLWQEEDSHQGVQPHLSRRSFAATGRAGLAGRGAGGVEAGLPAWRVSLNPSCIAEWTAAAATDGAAAAGAGAGAGAGVATSGGPGEYPSRQLRKTVSAAAYLSTQGQAQAQAHEVRPRQRDGEEAPPERVGASGMAAADPTSGVLERGRQRNHHRRFAEQSPGGAACGGAVSPAQGDAADAVEPAARQSAETGSTEASTDEAEFGTDMKKMAVSTVGAAPTAHQPGRRGGRGAWGAWLGSLSLRSGKDMASPFRAQQQQQLSTWGRVGAFRAESGGRSGRGWVVEGSGSYRASSLVGRWWLVLSGDVWDMLDKHLPMFMPSRARKCWDAALLGVTLYTAIAVPLEAGFHFSIPRGVSTSLTTCLAAYWVDIFVQFRTAFLSDTGELVRDSRAIAAYYCRTWFPLDLVSSMPWAEMLTYVLSRGGHHSRVGVFALLARLPRLLRLLRVLRELDRLAWGNALRIVRLFGMLMLLCHWTACLWHGLSELVTEWPWLFSDVTTRGALLHNYSVALYYAFVLLVGGDNPGLPPQNNAERAFMIAVLVAGSMMSALVISNMAMLVANFNSLSTRHVSRAALAADALRYLGAPPHFRARVADYYQFLELTEHPGPDADGFLSELPRGLVDDIKWALYSGYLTRLPLFEGCDEPFMAALQARLTLVSFSAGEVIYRADDIGRDMYIVRRGCVLLRSRRGELCGLLTEGGCFGELALLSQLGQPPGAGAGGGAGAGPRRSVTAVAGAHVDLVVLSQRAMAAVCRDHPTSGAMVQERLRLQLHTELAGGVPLGWGGDEALGLGSQRLTRGRSGGLAPGLGGGSFDLDAWFESDMRVMRPLPPPHAVATGMQQLPPPSRGSAGSDVLLPPALARPPAGLPLHGRRVSGDSGEAGGGGGSDGGSLSPGHPDGSNRGIGQETADVPVRVTSVSAFSCRSASEVSSGASWTCFLEAAGMGPPGEPPRVPSTTSTLPAAAAGRRRRAGEVAAAAAPGPAAAAATSPDQAIQTASSIFASGRVSTLESGDAGAGAPVPTAGDAHHLGAAAALAVGAPITGAPAGSAARLAAATAPRPGSSAASTAAEEGTAAFPLSGHVTAFEHDLTPSAHHAPGSSRGAHPDLESPPPPQSRTDVVGPSAGEGGSCAAAGSATLRSVSLHLREAAAHGTVPPPVSPAAVHRGSSFAARPLAAEKAPGPIGKGVWEGGLAMLPLPPPPGPPLPPPPAPLPPLEVAAAALLPSPSRVLLQRREGLRVTTTPPGGLGLHQAQAPARPPSALQASPATQPRTSPAAGHRGSPWSAVARVGTAPLAAGSAAPLAAPGTTLVLPLEERPAVTTSVRALRAAAEAAPAATGGPGPGQEPGFSLPGEAFRQSVHRGGGAAARQPTTTAADAASPPPRRQDGAAPAPAAAPLTSLPLPTSPPPPDQAAAAAAAAQGQRSDLASSRAASLKGLWRLVNLMGFSNAGSSGGGGGGAGAAGHSGEVRLLAPITCGPAPAPAPAAAADASVGRAAFDSDVEGSQHGLRGGTGARALNRNRSTGATDEAGGSTGRHTAAFRLRRPSMDAPQAAAVHAPGAGVCVSGPSDTPPFSPAWAMSRASRDSWGAIGSSSAAASPSRPHPHPGGGAEGPSGPDDAVAAALHTLACALGVGVEGGSVRGGPVGQTEQPQPHYPLRQPLGAKPPAVRPLSAATLAAALAAVSSAWRGSDGGEARIAKRRAPAGAAEAAATAAAQGPQLSGALTPLLAAVADALVRRLGTEAVPAVREAVAARVRRVETGLCDALASAASRLQRVEQAVSSLDASAAAAKRRLAAIEREAAEAAGDGVLASRLMGLLDSDCDISAQPEPDEQPATEQQLLPPAAGGSTGGNGVALAPSGSLRSSRGGGLAASGSWAAVLAAALLPQAKTASDAVEAPRSVPQLPSGRLAPLGAAAHPPSSPAKPQPRTSAAATARSRRASILAEAAPEASAAAADALAPAHAPTPRAQGPGQAVGSLAGVGAGGPVGRSFSHLRHSSLSLPSTGPWSAALDAAAAAAAAAAGADFDDEGGEQEGGRGSRAVAAASVSRGGTASGMAAHGSATPQAPLRRASTLAAAALRQRADGRAGMLDDGVVLDGGGGGRAAQPTLLPWERPGARRLHGTAAARPATEAASTAAAAADANGSASPVAAASGAAPPLRRLPLRRASTPALLSPSAGPITGAGVLSAAPAMAARSRAGSITTLGLVAVTGTRRRTGTGSGSGSASPGVAPGSGQLGRASVLRASIAALAAEDGEAQGASTSSPRAAGTGTGAGEAQHAGYSGA